MHAPPAVAGRTNTTLCCVATNVALTPPRRSVSQRWRWRGWRGPCVPCSRHSMATWCSACRPAGRTPRASALPDRAYRRTRRRLPRPRSRPWCICRPLGGETRAAVASLLASSFTARRDRHFDAIAVVFRYLPKVSPALAPPGRLGYNPPSIGPRAPVAQLDRAPDYEFGGQEFESLRARQLSIKVGAGDFGQRVFGRKLIRQHGLPCRDRF